jgi:hypothetical protein
VSIPEGVTLLQNACYWGSVTNPDSIELLVQEGAEPKNDQDDMGLTPLMCATELAPEIGVLEKARRRDHPYVALVTRLFCILQGILVQ